MRNLYILLLLMPFMAFAQPGSWIKIEFTQFIYAEKMEATLCFNQEESLYLFGNQTLIDTVSKKMTIRITDDIGTAVYKNLNENKLLYRVASKSQVSLVDDSFVPPTWTMTDEIKKENGLVLQKAVTFFRGRTYNAWFTEELPGSFGPWKLGGLPGTILELYTEDGVLNIRYTKIMYNQEKPDNLERILTKYTKTYTMKEFMEYARAKDEKFRAAVASNQPRDGKMTITTIGEPVERIYEWEE